MSPPLWSKKIAKARRQKSQLGILQSGVRALSQAKRDPVALKRYSRLALKEHPFDSHLLELSALYRQSRENFLKIGGSFRGSLLSSPRTLSSVALLSREIEYSPIERELIWAATDPWQIRHPEHLLEIRQYTTSIYHEQNHRVLWDWLPKAPSRAADIRRYLNFAESLVVALDMALGDELGPELARIFHFIGSTYDPGTTIRAECGSPRTYRNYLQAAMYATYLYLEGIDAADVSRVIQALFPNLGELAKRAATRATRLDRQFVERTNPLWQKKHSAEAARLLSKTQRGAPLILPGGPKFYLDNRIQYLFAESVFDRMGV